MATKYLKEKIFQLDVTILRSNPGQLRMFIDPGGLAEMAASPQARQLKVMKMPVTLFRKRRLS